MQPVEIDGWSSWNDNGCPCPVPDYPIAGWEEDDDMTDDDITKIARAVWDYALATGTAGTVLGSTLKQTDDIAGQVWAEPVDDITSGNPLKARDMLRYTRSDSNKTLNRVSD
jgi:hypothetical protein